VDVVPLRFHYYYSFSYYYITPTAVGWCIAILRFFFTIIIIFIIILPHILSARFLGDALIKLNTSPDNSRGDVITRYDYILTIMKSPKPATDNRLKKIIKSYLWNRTMLNFCGMNWFLTSKNFYRSPFSKWPQQYRTNSTLFNFNVLNWFPISKNFYRSPKKKRRIAIHHPTAVGVM
jgi:hypothetical protein